MKGSPVNLNRARKTREKVAAKNHADNDAAKFGRSKAEKLHNELEAKRALNQLEGHKKADT